MSVVADLPATCVEKYRPGPTINADATSSGGSIVYTVPNADLRDSLDTIAGKVELIGGTGGTVLRVVPLRHPDFDWMYARSLDAQAIGWEGQPLSGPPARVWEIRVNFANLPYPIDGTEAFLTRSTQPSVRVLDLPRSGVLVGGAMPSNDRAIVVEGFDMAITIHQMPYANEAAWYALAGSVNSDTFFGVGAGYVKYIGPSMTNSVTFAGVRTWEITHNFAFSRLKWNQEFDETGALVDLSVGGDPRYPDLNFWGTFFS